MRFSILTGNHNNHNGIADTVIFLRNALRDCGYDAQLNSGIVSDRYNIMMEHFPDAAQIESVAAAYKAGARYIVIGTEPIIDGVFNSGVVGGHLHYSNNDYWRQRTDGFLMAARYAEAIWVFAESMVEPYRALMPDKPVIFLPHGHVEGFRRYEHRPDDQKDIDFYSSGSLTEHRKGIMAELLRRGFNAHWDVLGVPDYLRFEHLSRAKVCLSLRLSPDNAIPSVSRMHFNLEHANYLAHEKYDLPCPLDPYVLHLPADDIVEWIQASLESPGKREVAEGTLARFRDEMPMSRLLPPILEASLSGRSLA
jgi:hypothetical protein